MASTQAIAGTADISADNAKSIQGRMLVNINQLPPPPPPPPPPTASSSGMIWLIAAAMVGGALLVRQHKEVAI